MASLAHRLRYSNSDRVLSLLCCHRRRLGVFFDCSPRLAILHDVHNTETVVGSFNSGRLSRSKGSPEYKSFGSGILGFLEEEEEEEDEEVEAYGRIGTRSVDIWGLKDGGNFEAREKSPRRNERAVRFSPSSVATLAGQKLCRGLGMSVADSRPSMAMYSSSTRSSSPPEGDADREEKNVTPSPKISWTMGPGGKPVPVRSKKGAGSGEDKPLSVWPGMYHSPVTAALWQARASIRERDGKHGTAPTTLVSKTPERSRTRVLYGFANDEILREQYRNPWNGCRIGKLLEDLDALAGTIAMKHCSDDDHMTRPLLLVTASVDKISLKKAINLEMDLVMKGAVAWVGRSSMEIRMEVIQPVQEKTQKENIALVANFTFVARDSETKKSAAVNQLVPESEEEKMLYALGEARDEHRKQQRKHGNADAAKAAVDTQRLRDILSEGRILCDMPALADRDAILIRDTRLENAIICQPQQRNMHGRIFGGFLMRRAFELAFSTCYVFGGIRPLFLEVDNVDFRKPVDVGNFLRFKACVLYTETERADRPLIHIEVVAYVTQPEMKSSEISNTFYFTFSLDLGNEDSTTTQVRRVLPETEEEARAYLRRFDADHLVEHPRLKP